MVVVMLRWQEIQKGGQTPWGSEVPLVHQTAERTSFVGTSYLGSGLPGSPRLGCLCPLELLLQLSQGLPLLL